MIIASWFLKIFRYQFLSEVSKTVFLTSMCFQPPVLFTDGKQAYGLTCLIPGLCVLVCDLNITACNHKLENHRPACLLKVVVWPFVSLWLKHPPNMRGKLWKAMCSRIVKKLFFKVLCRLRHFVGTFSCALLIVMKNLKACVSLGEIHICDSSRAVPEWLGSCRYQTLWHHPWTVIDIVDLFSSNDACLPNVKACLLGVYTFLCISW